MDWIGLVVSYAQLLHTPDGERSGLGAVSFTGAEEQQVQLAVIACRWFVAVLTVDNDAPTPERQNGVAHNSFDLPFSHREVTLASHRSILEGLLKDS